MMTEILKLVNQHKVYVGLFLFITMVSLFAWGTASKNYDEPLSSPQALQKYQQAENALQTKIKESGSLNAYLAAHPAQKRKFTFLSSLIILIFSSGLFLCLWLLSRPDKRKLLCVAVSEEQRTRWNLGMLVKVILLFLSAAIFLGLMIAMVRKLAETGLSDNFFILLHTTLIDFLCFYFIVHVIRADKGDWRDVGFHWPKTGLLREIGVGIIGYLAVIPVFILTLFFVMVIAKIFSHEPPPHPLVNVLLEEGQRSPVLMGYSIFLASVVAPVLEEIFFRGFCYPIFRAKWGIKVSMVVSSLLFAVIHANLFAFLPIFVLGLALAALFEIRNSLVAPITLHVVHNALFITYFFLAKDIVTSSHFGR